MLQIEGVLPSSAEFLQLTLDALSTQIAILDSSGVILAVNAAWRRFAEENGYQGTDYGIGQNYLGVCDASQGECAEEGPVVSENIRRVLAHDIDEFYLEYPCHSPTVQRWFGMRVSRFTYDGQLHAVVSHLNITERKLTELALAHSNRELQDFAYIASHDLQEPLRKILAFGERLKARLADHLDTESADYLERMLRASERMQNLIRDLLTFSRVTTKKQPYARVELEKVLQDVLLDLDLRIEQVNAQLEVGHLPSIEADALQMRQLFQNLIGNALKYHRPEVPPHIQISAEMLPDRTCRIKVADNGIGFEEKYLDRIFEVFQRLHGRGVYEGTGMGLAICRKIVERHHGTITATSTPEVGSTFIITLPVWQFQEK